MNLLKTLNYAPRPWRPQTLAYADRIDANGGFITEKTLGFIDRFVIECEAAGLWDKLIEVGPFAGSNLNAALVKLAFHPSAGGVLANTGFIEADYAETGANGGLVGDGSRFLNTGFAGTHLPDHGHLSFYMREDVSAVGNRAQIGVSGGSDHYWIGALNGAAGPDARYGATATASAAGTFDKGFYLLSRETDSSLVLYRDGVAVGANTSTPFAAKPSETLYLWGLNSGGAAARIAARGSFYSIGQALNSSEALAYQNAVRNLQLALNRAIA
jgi:hypothetical protein